MPEKRGSGRTGRRRYSEEEARLAGPRSLAHWRRRYGVAKVQSSASTSPATATASAPWTTSTATLPPPPAWFTPELVAIWREVVSAAPPGMLQACDHPVLVGYVAAIARHHSLAQQIVGDPAAVLQLGGELRRAAVEMRSAAKQLGLAIVERQRLTLPPPPPEEPVSEFKRFDVVLPAGARIPYTPPGKRRSTAPAS